MRRTVSRTVRRILCFTFAMVSDSSTSIVTVLQLYHAGLARGAGWTSCRRHSPRGCGRPLAAGQADTCARAAGQDDVEGAAAAVKGNE